MIAVVVGVVRHDRAADENASRLDAERARYSAALRAIDQRPPRFEASFTWLTPAQLRGLTAQRGAYRLVVDEVAQQVTRENMTALVVTQITPGSARLRLQVKRVEVPRRWSSTDPTDVITLGEQAGRRPAMFVEWTLPKAGATAIVPLYAHGPIALVPERLYIRRPQAEDVEISIADVLRNPVVFLDDA